MEEKIKQLLKSKDVVNHQLAAQMIIALDLSVESIVGLINEDDYIQFTFVSEKLSGKIWGKIYGYGCWRFLEADNLNTAGFKPIRLQSMKYLNKLIEHERNNKSD